MSKEQQKSQQTGWVEMLREDFDEDEMACQLKMEVEEMQRRQEPETEALKMVVCLQLLSAYMLQNVATHLGMPHK